VTPFRVMLPGPIWRIIGKFYRTNQLLASMRPVPMLSRGRGEELAKKNHNRAAA
jgi:hypothetical protein